MLIARIYEVLPLVCPQCGSEMRLVAFLTEAEPIQRILSHINEPTKAPEIAPARGPPDWVEADFDQPPDDNGTPAQPEPDYDFDQTVSW